MIDEHRNDAQARGVFFVIFTRFCFFPLSPVPSTVGGFSPYWFFSAFIADSFLRRTYTTHTKLVSFRLRTILYPNTVHRSNFSIFCHFQRCGIACTRLYLFSACLLFCHKRKRSELGENRYRTQTHHAPHANGESHQFRTKVYWRTALLIFFARVTCSSCSSSSRGSLTAIGTHIRDCCCCCCYNCAFRGFSTSEVTLSHSVIIFHYPHHYQLASMMETWKRKK